MKSLPEWYAPLLFLIAAIWALVGTNSQASLAKTEIQEDDDPLIADAGKLWLPAPRLATKARRQRVAVIEAEIRKDATRWIRYKALRQQLWSWNMLESSVALAAVASILALLSSLG